MKARAGDVIEAERRTSQLLPCIDAAGGALACLAHNIV
jgi:hypothetical protein